PAAWPRPRRRRAGGSRGAPRHAGRHRQRAPRRLVAGRRAAAAGRHPASVLSVRYEVIGGAGIGEVRAGDAVAALVIAAAARQATPLQRGGLAAIRQERLSVAAGGHAAVSVAGTRGGPWREGLTNIAIGVAGFAPLKSYLGERDPAGRPLQATILALADELASAAEPVMGKLDRVPAAIVRGLPLPPDDGSGSKALLRDPARDPFR